jgi:hypothetical protein
MSGTGRACRRADNRPARVPLRAAKGPAHLSPAETVTTVTQGMRLVLDFDVGKRPRQVAKSGKNVQAAVAGVWLDR